MRKKRRHLLLTLFVLMSILSFRVSVNAEITGSIDGLQDSVTGLEWLHMSSSVGISYDSIIDPSDPTGLASQGWTHASLAEISTLFMNAGITPPYTGGIVPQNFDGANLIITLLGATGNFIQAFSGQGPQLGFLYTPVVIISSSRTAGGADSPGPSVPSSVTNPTIGSWLVRPIPAPEPYEFSELTITKAKVKFGDGSNNDDFMIIGEFILSESSDSIAPVIEDVEISVGTSHLLIPANSFVEKQIGKYEFMGNVDGADVRMRIEATDVDTYIFVIHAKGVDLADTFNPVNIKLLIGDDTGTIDLRLKGVLSL